jgi:hypothetical protein
MNIFFLDWNPKKAAEYHCDKHVVKMILECAQLLYCAHWILSPCGVPEFAYKKTHVNHPCSIWVRESVENYEWLCNLAMALCEEFTFRYGKTHKTQKHIEWLIRNPPFDIPAIHQTPIRLAMPDEYKNEDPIESYRRFYRESKMKQRGIVSYKKRDWPEFLMVK